VPEHRRTPEWRRSVEATKYPFTERATLTNKDGRVILEGCLLDAALYPVGGLERMFLSRVEVSHDTVTVYAGDSGNRLRCSGSFGLIRPASLVSLEDSFGRPAGVLVSETRRLGIFQSWGVGNFDFVQDQTEFVASVCFPTPEDGVRGVLLPDGTLLTGDVWLVGEDGVVIRTDTDVIPDECGVASGARVVRVDVVGDPLFRRRLCEPASLFTTPRLVKALRVLHSGGEFVCTPDVQGNINIVTATTLIDKSALRVTTAETGVNVAVAGEAVF
jgi:hypothetical protein